MPQVRTETPAGVSSLSHTRSSELAYRCSEITDRGVNPQQHPDMTPETLAARSGIFPADPVTRWCWRKGLGSMTSPTAKYSIPANSTNASFILVGRAEHRSE